MGKIRAKKKSLIPKAKPAAWIPPGQAVTVGGYLIPDGMVYVGQDLTAANRRGAEPALIDPSLPIGAGEAEPVRSLAFPGSWPTYGQMSPQSRAAYLRWLASGRSAPDADLNHLLLFLYGLERRLLFDAQVSRVSSAEWLKLTGEVERLLDLCQESHLFRFYAGPFLTFTRLLLGDRRIEAFEARLTTFGDDVIWRVGPSLFAAAGRPLSAPWALALWGDWQLARRGTAERRCPKEFRELFAIRYREAFPDGGFRLKRGRQPFIARYRPVSPGFDRILLVEALGLTEVRISGAHLQQLQKIADLVSSELDPYSRRIGRNAAPSSLAALSLLPPELQSRGSEASRSFVAWIEEILADGDCATVTRAELLERWPVEKGRLGARGLEALAGFLGQHGFGIEPDLRFGAPPPREAFALYRLPPGTLPGEPGLACHAAAAVLQLAVHVATAGGEVDPRQERRLLEHVEQAAHLEAVERARLAAHLHWLLAEPPGLTGIRPRVQTLAENRRHAIGRFLITVAAADGHVSAEEIERLTRIYTLLGLDPQTLYTDAHALAASETPCETPSAFDPVVVRPATAGPGGFVLPEEPAVPGGVALDLRKIEAKLAETRRVASLLDEVFSDEEPGAALPAASSVITATGLDAAHTTFLKALAASATWTRAEMERLAAACGLLPDGALEVLNEAAFARCGAPLVEGTEGDEVLEIDRDILESLLA